LVLLVSRFVSRMVSIRLCMLLLLLLLELLSLLLLLLLLMRIFSHHGSSGSGIGGGGGISGVISMQTGMQVLLRSRRRRGAPMFCIRAVPVKRKKNTWDDLTSISAHKLKQNLQQGERKAM